MSQADAPHFDAFFEIHLKVKISARRCRGRDRQTPPLLTCRRSVRCGPAARSCAGSPWLHAATLASKGLSRSNTRATCTALHSPLPREVGIFRAFKPAAIARSRRSPVAPSRRCQIGGSVIAPRHYLSLVTAASRQAGSAKGAMTGDHSRRWVKLGRSPAFIKPPHCVGRFR